MIASKTLKPMQRGAVTTRERTYGDHGESG
jgi:hypothetical protein